MTQVTAQQSVYYHMGIKPGSNCPLENVHIRGQNFPLKTAIVTRDQEGMTTSRSEYPGVVRPLTEKQVEDIKADLPNHIIRGRRKLHKKAPNYGFARHGDTPIAEFLFIRTLHPEKDSILLNNFQVDLELVLEPAEAGEVKVEVPEEPDAEESSSTFGGSGSSGSSNRRRGGRRSSS